ncbi:hypothetical protein BH09MYX1_BH09MYX1_43490 [soil metagenome]
MKRIGWVTLLAGGIVVLVACRGTAPDAPPPKASPDATPLAVPPARVALQHRATALACPARVPHPGYVNTPAEKLSDMIACNTDADCKGMNARCHHGPRVGTYCSADACATDADCGAGKLCECGSDANVCLLSGCRTDADCGGFSCSPTGAERCGNMSGTVGYYCHTPKDECTDDDDCNKGAAAHPNEPDGRCTYKSTVAHFTCSFEMCVG